MATASGNPMDMLEKELTCSICLNLLQEPKDLDCPHTYCFDCLKQYVKKKSTIDCPDCRYITIVPQGGLVNLKTNLRLKNVVENLIKGTGHQMSSKKQIEVPTCPDHIGERQHFICVTCNISVCRDCLVLKHPKPQHEIREWKEVMEDDEKQRRKKNQEFDDVEQKLKSAKDKAKQEVKSRIQQATTEMKTWEKKMDQDIETTYQTRIKILQEKRKELNRSVTSGISKVSIQQDQTLPQDMTIFCFKPGKLSLSNFGELVTSDKKTVISANQKWAGSANKELKLTLLKTLELDVCYVAANQSNSIAVSSFWSTHITVYDNLYNVGYKQQCQFEVLNQCSVAFTSLGILVCERGKVKVFSQAGKHENTWPISVDAFKIANAPDDMVVIGHKSGDAITVHRCDGELIRRHQVNCSNMRDIASNGDQIAFTTNNAVCVIDFVTGRTLRTLHMQDPRGVCYVHNSNNLLVSRMPGVYHGVIEQYCSTTGRLISRLASHLFNPRGITVTQDNKLVVAAQETLIIYKISK